MAPASADLHRSNSKSSFIFSFRFVITILGFAGCLVRQASNNALNFSITCMVDSSAYLSPTDNHSSCAVFNDTNDYKGTYLWDRNIQSYVIAALNFGTVAVIFGSGVICDKFGVKRLYVLVMAILSITSLVIPVVSDNLGWVGLFVVRFIQGSAMVVGWPALLVMSNQWFVGYERTIFQILASSGSQIGAIVAYAISGVFCNRVGWRYIYYLFGAFTGAVGIAWLVLYSDSAETSMFIGEKERNYVIRGRAIKSKTATIPWRAILTSLPVWSIIVINFGQNYLFYFVGQFGPTYYKEVLGINSDQSGIFTALPFLCQLIGRNTAALIMRFCEGKVSPTLFVKLTSVGSGIVPGVLIIAVTAFDCDDRAAAICLFSLSFFFFGSIMVGYIRATSLIAPMYTGTISGLSQTAMFLAAVVCPFITGALTPNSTAEEWKNALYIVGAVAILGTVFFLIFGSAEVQKWAKEKKLEMKEVEDSSTENENAIAESFIELRF